MTYAHTCQIDISHTLLRVFSLSTTAAVCLHMSSKISTHVRTTDCMNSKNRPVKVCKLCGSRILKWGRIGVGERNLRLVCQYKK